MNPDQLQKLADSFTARAIACGDNDRSRTQALLECANDVLRLIPQPQTVPARELMAPPPPPPHFPPPDETEAKKPKKPWTKGV